MNRLAPVLIALSLAGPAAAQPSLVPSDRIRREDPYRPRHLLPVAAVLAALGLLGVAWLKVRRAKREALERL